MRKFFSALLLLLLVFSLSACGANVQEPAITSTPEVMSSEIETSASQQPVAPAASLEPMAPEVTPSAAEEPEDAARRISVQFGENVVVYALNDSPAASSLYAQLPLTITVEDYSTNEKIFYPPEELDTSGSPLAQGGPGTLAYYAPWGDVVMFYGGYNENSSLYELGQAVSGADLVSEMSGTVTITIVD